MDYRYYTVEKREDAYRVYGWRELPDTEALKAQDFGRDVVATFPSESQALKAYPQAKTILRGRSLLLRPTWPEERARQPKHWTMSFIYKKKSVVSRRRVA
jgi:hypothetical protein